MNDKKLSTDSDRLHVDLMFPSKFVKSGELPPGEDVTLTIHRVSMQDLPRTDGTQSRLPVVEFAEMQRRPESLQKRLVLNKTNARVIAALYGPVANEWIGKRITLYATTCQAFGKTTDCIRIRETVPADDPRGREPEEENPL